MMWFGTDFIPIDENFRDWIRENTIGKHRVIMRVGNYEAIALSRKSDMAMVMMACVKW